MLVGEDEKHAAFHLPLIGNPKPALRISVRAAQGHHGQVVVTWRAGAEVFEVAEAGADKLRGRKRVVSAEELAEPFGAVLGAQRVARLGEAVGEEEECVARLGAKLLGGELFVAEDADGSPVASMSRASPPRRRSGGRWPALQISTSPAVSALPQTSVA